MRIARAIAYAAWFYGVTLAFCLAGVGIRLFARHLALPLANRWARTALAGLWPICRIRVVMTGLDRLPPDGPVLLAGQHQSAFDTLVWMAVLDRPSYVMKAELRRIPLFGPLLVPAGMIPVDRLAGATALRGLVRATADAARQGRQIVIFPEGSRIPPGGRVKLQPGLAAVAARIGVPLLPVATDSGVCWPRSLLGKTPGVIHVDIGPPIPLPCPREAMLAQVEDYWRTREAAWSPPVDNSVDAVRVPLRAAQGDLG
jgi:1-acyl-sn-glycerol-3-phosphate acyltransferase